MTGRAEYIIAADTSEADKSVAKLERRMKSATDGSGGLAAKQKDLKKSFDDTAESIGGSATALSGLAGVMGGTTQATSDVVGAIDNFVSAFRGGGPVALAITAGTTALGLLIGKWWEAKQAAKQAAEESAKAARSLAEEIQKAAGDAEREAARIRLSNVGINITDVQARAAQAIKAERELGDRVRQLAAEVAQREQLQGVSGPQGALLRAEAVRETGRTLQDLKAELKEAETAWDAQVAVVSEIDGALVKYNRTLSDLQAAQARQKELEDAKAKAADEAAAAVGRLTRAHKKQAEVLGLADELEAERTEHERIAARAREVLEWSEQQAKEDARKWAREQELKGEEQLAEAKRKIREAERDKFIADLKLREDAWSDLGGKAVDTAQGIAQTAGGELLGLFDSLAAKDEQALERFSSNFMRSIGQQLVGIGIRSTFEGTAKLFNPVTAPIGGAEIAFGVSAIAAGTGLGAAGAFTAPQQSQSSGVNRGARSTSAPSGGGGITNLTLVYGIPGHPEHVARTIREVERDGGRLLGDGLRRGRR